MLTNLLLSEVYMKDNILSCDEPRLELFLLHLFLLIFILLFQAYFVCECLGNMLVVSDFGV